MRLSLLALTAAVAASAAGHETQHAVDATLALRPKLDLLLHGRIRTEPRGLGLYQLRGGPVLTWDVFRRLSLLSGYYYAEQESASGRDFIGGHRLFTGLETPLVRRRRYSLDSRTLAERFLLHRAPHFNRFRTRIRIVAKAPVAPYASAEQFFDSQGWRSARYAAGIRWRPSPGVQVDCGYFYETRARRTGPDRHMWLTSVHFHLSSGKSGDPDL